ncbi:MAG TPA: MFS transporter [Candidatus Acidoferrales bacterium]|nr:MFS transporter [Candidatus Acidoferrales bacterium]
MKPPCDEAVIASGHPGIPCPTEAGPWILAATILGSSMAFIDGTVVNVALPALQSSLGGTVIDMQWVVESYGLFLSALILAGGSMGDLFGRRRIFLVGVATFATASAGCGLAHSIRQLVLTRAMQGVGAALLVPGSLSIISASFGEKERGRAIGTWSGFTAITAAMGPILGGWLIEHASWRWIFFINVPIAAAVIVFSLWRVPESSMEQPKSVDWIGALIVTAGLAGVTYGFLESPKSGWTNPSVWGALIVGCACLVAFPSFEAHARAPMVPLGLFRSRNFAGANWLTLFLYAALGIFFFLFPLNLIQVRHYSATATGAAALPLILLMFLLSRWSGGLVARYGAKPPLVIGPLIAAVGFLLFAVPSDAGGYWTAFFPGFVVLGLGMAVSVAPLTTVVMGAVDQNHAGTASGINNAVARVAGLFAVAILGIVMVGAFSRQMSRSLAQLNLPAGVQHALESNEITLAGLTIPAELDPTTAATLRVSVDRAFLSGFRLIMLICASLAVTSAAFSGATIVGPARRKRGFGDS